MTENLKPDLPRRTNINYRRNTFKKSDKKENAFLNRMLFRICTCAIIVVFVLAVSKADGEKMKNFKYRLKNAVSQSITKDELADTGKFLKTSPPASKQKTCVKKKFLTQAGFIQPNRFLIVIGEQFKISFRMQAGRTNFGRSFADMYITAFTAIPADFFRAGKDQIIPYIL